MPKFQPAELILNADGSIYHLNLLPGDVAKNIILVGDPGRVSEVSAFFDTIHVNKGKREFLTHTGEYNKMPVSVISTGIGTDNIDIVLNELDALFNLDFEKQTEKTYKTNLSITRLGTCGALQPEVEPGTPIISEFGMGLDNLAQFYDLPTYSEEDHLLNKLHTHFDQKGFQFPFYLFSSSASLKQNFTHLGPSGITVTCPGFYGPQGRSIRLNPARPDFFNALRNFELKGLTIQNLEMETSALLALGRGLDHDCCTVNLALANRHTGQILQDYKTPLKRMIKEVLEAWPDI